MVGSTPLRGRPHRLSSHRFDTGLRRLHHEGGMVSAPSSPRSSAPRQPRNSWLALCAILAMLAGACSSAPDSGEAHDHEAHDHGDESVAHDHPVDAGGDGSAATDHGGSDDEAAAFDHHGNPIHDELFYGEVTQNGVSVEFTMQSFLGIGGRGADLASEIVDGANSAVIFKIADESGNPIEAARPLAWLDPGPAASEEQCQAQIAGYISGALTERPMIDFNGFFLLALNEGPTISVIDPNVDVAGFTQLFSVMLLRGPGEDWVKTSDGERMVVSVPSHGEVAVADLDAFTVLDHVDAGPNPVRVALAPGGRDVWVGNDAGNGLGGVTVVDPYGLASVATIATGDGHHEITFSPDGAFAYVTNGDAETLSVVDTEELDVVADIDVGAAASAAEVSTASGDVYVGSATGGEIVVVDGSAHRIVERIPVNSGIAALRFAPDGRWGFAASAAGGNVFIFDALADAIRYVVPVHGAPDQISFSETHAYIRSAEAPAMTSIPLADLGGADAVPAASLPVGQAAPAAVAATAAADALLAAPGTVFVANPADDQIHYYPEGATAASGSFQGHGLVPRAVEIVDRSMKETAPGVFTGKLRIPAAGTFQVAFLLEQPRVIHCFEFTANPDPSASVTAEGEVDLEILDAPLDAIRAGKAQVVRVLLTDPATGPIDGVTDLQMVVSAAAGNWSDRYQAVASGDGTYDVELTLPDAGFYRLFFEVPSLGATVEDMPTATLEAVP